MVVVVDVVVVVVNVVVVVVDVVVVVADAVVEVVFGVVVAVDCSFVLDNALVAVVVFSNMFKLVNADVVEIV